MTTTNPDSSVPPNNSSLPAAATTAGQVQLRMSDYLALPQDDEPDEKSLETHTQHRDLRSLLMGEEGFFQEDRRRVSYCSSPPCRLVARWMSWIRRVKFKGISRKCCRRETVGNRVEAGVQPRCLTNGLNDVGCRKETCFNAGIGAYLLYLVAATRNELDRFNAARVEMEAILQSTKQLQRRRSVEVDGGDDDVLFEVSIRKSVVVEEDDGDDDDDECEAEFPTNLYALPAAAAASSASSSNVVSGSETPKREDFAEDMEQLEAELEAELELLQLQLDGDTSMEQSQFLRVTNGDETGSSKSYSTTSTEEEEEEEVIDPEYGEEDAECPNAIHPYELASKLHEVLEARQQEEIRELEAALELVKRKLVEKELQVAWWKAVARGRRLSIGSSQEVQS